MNWYNTLANLSSNECIQPLDYAMGIMRGSKTHNREYKNDFVWCWVKDGSPAIDRNNTKHGYKEVILSMKLLDDLNKGFKIIKYKENKN